MGAEVLPMDTGFVGRQRRRMVGLDTSSQYRVSCDYHIVIHGWSVKRFVNAEFRHDFGALGFSR